MEIRYSEKKEFRKEYIIKADELISVILGSNIPEIDVDKYVPSLEITI